MFQTVSSWGRRFNYMKQNSRSIVVTGTSAGLGRAIVDWLESSRNAIIIQAVVYKLPA
jgi:short-subunit dehydrogenase involved in D-alanine esterification of teichoic acids